MTDKELIEKAKKIVEIIGLSYDEKISPTISKEFPKLLLESSPELENEILISFESKIDSDFDIRGTSLGDGITVVADKKTNKLLYVLTKSNMYEVPDELK